VSTLKLVTMSSLAESGADFSTSEPEPRASTLHTIVRKRKYNVLKMPLFIFEYLLILI
jgi:hypothetical protein